MITPTADISRMRMIGVGPETGALQLIKTAAMGAQLSQETRELNERLPIRTSSDANDTLLEPALHDGRLMSISLADPKVAILRVIDVMKKKWDIYLEGLQKLRADEFSEGNIILDVTIGDFREADIEYVGLLYANKSISAAERIIAERATRESWKLVEINPSYGCHLVALCRSVTVSTIGE